MEITSTNCGRTVVAAKYLARKNSSVATICGCGEQGRAHVRALSLMFPFRKIYAFDIDPKASQDLATQLSRESRVDIEPVHVSRVRLNVATWLSPARLRQNFMFTKKIVDSHVLQRASDRRHSVRRSVSRGRWWRLPLSALR